MDLSKLRFHILRITDSNFSQRPAKDIALTDEEVPEGALGYERGPHSVMAHATTDESDLVIASASAHVLVHPNKPPLLHVVYAGSDPPYTKQGLERAVVNCLIESARNDGYRGVWLCEKVRAIYEGSLKNPH